ncbi:MULTISPECIES: hypothetical protein [Deinococcus]|uniref:Uncharacterized protein n=1 Tax=Deinococcus xianganensis TaxID=1507289 RepID=A0A6I4YB35_9DEIO|nr:MULTISPECIES: hypothetical protein [Deinococcus]MXV18612.1 hypothetical protein [Deinococcus xianganensis]GGB80505.1 hypothetical protein GCM10008019_40940 [Deinococcus soli (ex Cha et al. 2016)]
MNNRTEEIILTTLAAYGLLKLLEGLIPTRPRQTVLVVDADTARELLDDETETD